MGPALAKLAPEADRHIKAGTEVITVNIPGKGIPHDIVVGRDILGELRGYMDSLGLSRDALIISSPNVHDLYGAKVDAALKAAGCNTVQYVLFDDGEENKTLPTWQYLLEVINKFEDLRESRMLIVNLGGGVVGDVGAFAAACYERGRDYIQIPTTLLAQVDCGIGGKCGVNFKAAKNLIGQFHQPRLVLADLNFLKTVPKRELRSGLAEVIKYGVILEPGVLDYVDAHLTGILDGDLDAMEYLANKCFRLKVDVVQQDERDQKDIRAKLNFGHTVGHALEAATDYIEYTHGEAISVGMICACEIAERMQIVSTQVRHRLESLFIRVGLPTTMSANADRIMASMAHDKKFAKGVNKFILPTAVGKVEVVTGIDMNLVRKVVEGRIVSA